MSSDFKSRFEKRKTFTQRNAYDSKKLFDVPVTFSFLSQKNWPLITAKQRTNVLTRDSSFRTRFGWEQTNKRDSFIIDRLLSHQNGKFCQLSLFQASLWKKVTSFSLVEIFLRRCTNATLDAY